MVLRVWAGLLPVLLISLPQKNNNLWVVKSAMLENKKVPKKASWLEVCYWFSQEKGRRKKKVPFAARKGAQKLHTLWVLEDIGASKPPKRTPRQPGIYTHRELSGIL